MLSRPIGHETAGHNTAAGNPNAAQASPTPARAFHPLADIFPLMEGDEFNELVKDIRRNGLKQNIIVHEGKILDGRNRYRACLEAGVDPHDLHLAPYRGDDPIAFVISMNVHRRHLTLEQKRELVANLLKADPGRSNNATAKIAKVSDHTVAKVRTKLESTSHIAKLTKTTGADGKARPAKKLPPQKAKSKPKDLAPALKSLSFFEASQEVQTKFVSDVGLGRLFEVAPPDQRDGVLAKYCRPNPPTVNKPLAYDIGDGLDIPGFLKRDGTGSK